MLIRRFQPFFVHNIRYLFTNNLVSPSTPLPSPKIAMEKTIFSDLNQIFRSSVCAVLPEKLIRNTLEFDKVNDQLTINGENYDLLNKNIYLVGTGKAVQNMAAEVENILGSRIEQGIVSIPFGSMNGKSSSQNVVYYEGARNNLPDKNAEDTAFKVNNLVRNLSSSDILLVLISGGGSALLPLPKEPITLDEKSLFVMKLANAGADIIELNTVRKRISALKGGQLAILAQPADVIALVLSDIVGDPLDLIASGPTTENQDKHDAAIKIVKKYNLYDTLPDTIKTVLSESTKQVIFPKSKVKNYVIGSNKISIRHAKNEAKNLGYFTIDLSSTVTGNVSDIGKEYTKLTKILCDFIDDKYDREMLKQQISLLNIPGFKMNTLDNDEVLSALKTKDICLILGGEITVEVKGTGKGGRNQQLALEFSNIIHEFKSNFSNVEVYLLSAGTDGIDGPTDAAGAIGYLDLVADAKEANIDVEKYLQSNDSYNFYRDFKQGALHVITGHTNTNVMDMHLIVIKRKQLV